jgi:hypothetical protein
MVLSVLVRLVAAPFRLERLVRGTDTEHAHAAAPPLTLSTVPRACCIKHETGSN